MKVTITRKIEFDAGHRVMRHESKCANPHGHRYVAEIVCSAPVLDDLGRVIDFGVVKDLVGGWVDDNWDHATILNSDDTEFLAFLAAAGYKVRTLDRRNPTAEYMAQELHRQASRLLSGTGVHCVRVRLYETPNCWADYPAEGA